MQAEVFYLYHQGEQRGPYTARQVNHMHACEFIDDDTLYWREGLEQWAPVTQIVLRRRRRRRLIWWTGLFGVLATLFVVLWFFGPVTLNAWREMTAGTFTAPDAYYRARSMVRQAAGDASIRFDGFDKAKVLIQPPDAASVVLTGEIRDTNGTHRAAWRVRLRHDAQQQVWLPAAKETQP